MGLSSGIDLLYMDEWPVARDAGLTVSMGYPSRRENFIQTGFNHPANHTLLLGELETALPLAGRAGCPELDSDVWQSRTLSATTGQPSTRVSRVLQRLRPLAEECGGTVCVELLNSRINHPSYQGDPYRFRCRGDAGREFPTGKTAL